MVIFQLSEPDWGTPEALSLTTLLHTADEPDRLDWARNLMRPRVVLFLDEPSWQSARMLVREQPHHIPDPHRDGKVYEGFWGRSGDQLVIGKAPQHPATHRLYRTDDMDAFLRSVPLASGRVGLD